MVDVTVRNDLTRPRLRWGAGIAQATAIFLLTAAAPWVQADFASGKAAYDEGDYEAAHKEFLYLAETGDPSAQTILGVLYENGAGVKEDKLEAVKWYRLAAEQGSMAAQTNLGFMFDTGSGVPEDNNKAALWFRAAAEQGSELAQYNLGSFYLRGEGVDQDLERAVEWFETAGDSGLTRAFVRLAELYGTGGEGIEKDSAIAAKYLVQAAEKGDGRAQYLLGNMFAEGEGVAKDYVKAYAWCGTAAGNGMRLAVTCFEHMETLMSGPQRDQARNLAREYRKKFRTTSPDS
ncbi:MAG: TPR repeat protein [Gammaproteobacteria bacterium]|jgi:TPR repeat protein